MWASAGVYYALPARAPQLVLPESWPRRLLETPPPDGLILAAFAALSAWLAVWLLGGRLKPGLCRKCGYDISASLGFGRCPECGCVLSASTLGAPKSV
jgi:hypothetical protein